MTINRNLLKSIEIDEILRKSMKSCSGVILHFHMMFTCTSYYFCILVTLLGFGHRSGPLSHITGMFLVIFLPFDFHIFEYPWSGGSVHKVIFESIGKLHAGSGSLDEGCLNEGYPKEPLQAHGTLHTL